MMTKDQNTDPAGEDLQAPKYMRPKKPVLDEPLEGWQEEVSKEKKRIVTEAPAPQPGKTSPPENPPEDSSQQAVPSVVEEVEAKTTAKEAAHSPYFPRGIYEDAQAVEAYYGREKDLNTESASRVKKAGRVNHPFRRRKGWFLLAIIIVLIVVLVFLALTDSIPLNLF